MKLSVTGLRAGAVIQRTFHRVGQLEKKADPSEASPQTIFSNAWSIRADEAAQNSL
jgi:hypothetical protein